MTLTKKTFTAYTETPKDTYALFGTQWGNITNGMYHALNEFEDLSAKLEALQQHWKKNPEKSKEVFAQLKKLTMYCENIELNAKNFVRVLQEFSAQIK